VYILDSHLLQPSWQLSTRVLTLLQLWAPVV